MTVQNVIDKVRVRFPDFKDDTYACSIVQEWDEELCSEWALRTAIVTLTMSANVREIAMPSYVVGVRNCMFVKSSTERMALEPVPLYILPEQEREWRYEDCQPASVLIGTGRYYLDGDNLGLVPGPNFTTDPASTSGYPRLEIDAAVIATATLTVGATLPAAVRSQRIYVDGCCYLHAMNKYRDQVEKIWFPLRERALNDMARYDLTRVKNLHHRVEFTPDTYQADVI